MLTTANKNNTDSGQIVLNYETSSPGEFEQYLLNFIKSIASGDDLSQKEATDRFRQIRLLAYNKGYWPVFRKHFQPLQTVILKRHAKDQNPIYISKLITYPYLYLGKTFNYIQNKIEDILRLIDQSDNRSFIGNRIKQILPIVQACNKARILYEAMDNRYRNEEWIEAEIEDAGNLEKIIAKLRDVIVNDFVSYKSIDWIIYAIPFMYYHFNDCKGYYCSRRGYDYDSMEKFVDSMFSSVINEISVFSNQNRTLIGLHIENTLKVACHIITELLKDSLFYSEVITTAVESGCAKLLKTIHEDYLKTKKSDWLEVCARSRVASLAMHAQRYIEPDFKKIDDIYAKKMDAMLSLKRFQLHKSIFQSKPINCLFVPDDISGKILDCINQLAKEKAVIGDKIYHWTTQENLKNIIHSQFFYGNTALQRKMIFFTKNALHCSDVYNGDGNVICFAPYMVDPLALKEKEGVKLKKNLVRLTLDTRYFPTVAKYNQFFKLADFCSPVFSYSCVVSDFLKSTISKEDAFKLLGNPSSSYSIEWGVFLKISISGKEFPSDMKNRHKAVLAVEISLRNKTFKGILYKKDCIFYGNVSAINHFCLLKLFRLCRKDPEFYKELLEYLDSLPVDEIKKILTCFARSLVIYSEYNFNARLPLTHNLISEAYLVKENKLMNLNASNNEEYQGSIQKLLQQLELEDDKRGEQWKKLKNPVLKTENGCIYGSDSTFFGGNMFGNLDHHPGDFKEEIEDSSLASVAAVSSVTVA